MHPHLPVRATLSRRGDGSATFDAAYLPRRKYSFRSLTPANSPQIDLKLWVSCKLGNERHTNAIVKPVGSKGKRVFIKRQIGFLNQTYLAKCLLF